MAYEVLIFSDDLAVTDTLSMHLEAEGMLVDVTDNRLLGYENFEKKKQDLVVIDMTLSDCDIIQMSRRIREIRSDTVIVILTPEDKQKGIALELFENAAGEMDINNVDELLALVGQHYWNYQQSQCNREVNGIYSCGELVVDMVEEKIYLNREEQKASELTVKLLIYLIRNADTYKSKRDIYQTVWNNPASENDSTVMAHIRALRKVLGDTDVMVPKYIHTKRGVGYMFRCDCCEVDLD